MELHWLRRRRRSNGKIKGHSMLNHFNHSPAAAPASPLSPDEWLNAVWIATRVMSILGHPPVIMGFEVEGTPEIVWADPDDNWVACVLDFKIDIKQPANSKLCLHISEHNSEGATLALVGLCTMRDASWDMIPDESPEEDSLDTHPVFVDTDDTKSGS